MTIWRRTKRKVIRAWNRFKAWGYAILVALGLVVAIPTQAIEMTVTYTRATEYMDGTPMPLSDIQESRLYCDGVLVSTELGADQDWNPNMAAGTYQCYGTHVDILGRESGRSNTVTKTVIPGLPNPPILDN